MLASAPKPPAPALIAAAVSILIALFLVLHGAIPQHALEHWTGTTGRHHGTRIHTDGITLVPAFSPELRNATALPLVTRTERIIDELFDRFEALAARRPDLGAVIDDVPECTLTIGEQERYATIANYSAAHGIFIAANLYNSEAVIPSLSQNLLRSIAWLGPDNVYVSIFENGSVDATAAMLAELAAALAALGVKEVWVASPPLRSDYGHSRRIAVLAEIRNMALKPLYAIAEANEQLREAGREPITVPAIDTLIFANDIVSCHVDTLELVHQKHIHNADHVCSTDCTLLPTGYTSACTDTYSDQGLKTGEGLLIYDSWVNRGINGDTIYRQTAEAGFHFLIAPLGDAAPGLFLPQGKGDQQRWRRGRPIPVYSCWNGISVLDATLFTELGLRFRAAVADGWRHSNGGGERLSAWDQLLLSNISCPPLRSPDQNPATSGASSLTPYLEDDCPASECQLLDRDIWNLRDKKARVLMVPRSRCAYDASTYAHIRHIVPLEASPVTDDAIDWSSVVAPDQVVCYSDVGPSGQALPDPWKGGARYFVAS